MENEEFYSVACKGDLLRVANFMFNVFGFNPRRAYCRNCGCDAFIFPVSERAKRYFLTLGYTVHDFNPLHETHTKEDFASGKTDS